MEKQKRGEAASSLSPLSSMTVRVNPNFSLSEPDSQSRKPQLPQNRKVALAVVPIVAKIAEV